MSTVESQSSACGCVKVLYLGFNQDYTSLAVGTSSGYTIHDITSESFPKIFSDATTKDVHLFGRVFSSSFIAFVSIASPRKLLVRSFIKGKELADRMYFDKIVALRINRQRIVVVTEDKLYIHSMKNLDAMHTIHDVPLNPKGICALSNNYGTSYLAYPGNVVTGEVQIFDVTNYKTVISISAHKGPLASLAYDLSGTKLATASDKGTVIRVFSIPDGQPLHELRRGVMRFADISCIAFSRDFNYLCVSSNTQTVHIFRLVDESGSGNNVDAANGSASWMGYFGSMVSITVGYFSTEASNVLNQDRAFATARLPVADVKNVCAIVTIHQVQYVIVACSNGYAYVYSLDTKNGGECQLLRQHCISPGVCLKCNDSTPFRYAEDESITLWEKPASAF